MPSSTYWFLIGFLRARLDNEDFKYLELVLSESIMEEHFKGQKGNQSKPEEEKGSTVTTVLTTDCTSYELANNRIKNGLKPY